MTLNAGKSDPRAPGPNQERWHIDKGVPLALLLAIAAHAGVALWWAASYSAVTDARLDTLENVVAARQDQGNRLVRVETQIENLQDTVNETRAAVQQMNDKLDRIFNRQREIR